MVLPSPDVTVSLVKPDFSYMEQPPLPAPSLLGRTVSHTPTVVENDTHGSPKRAAVVANGVLGSPPRTPKASKAPVTHASPKRPQKGLGPVGQIQHPHNLQALTDPIPMNIGMKLLKNM